MEFRTPKGLLRAVDGTSFSVPDGSITAVVGESGCGKTTLGRALMGVMAKTARIAGGEINFAGRDIVKLPPGERRALRWRDIAFIPQSAMSSLDPVYRIGTQLGHILMERGGLSRAASRQRSRELFAMIGIDGGRLADFPHQFSGGMRQRVAIAMALALEPRLIIADEPVTALDVIVQRQILDVLRALRERLGISVILITHDISVVAYACDRMAVMYAGRIVEEGPVAEVLQAPAHPYTMGLANAFPDLRGTRDALIPIYGEPPDLHHPPAGCRFRPRCPFVLPLCTRDVATTPAAPDHDVACWRHDEAPALRRRARDLATWEVRT